MKLHYGAAKAAAIACLLLSLATSFAQSNKQQRSHKTIPKQEVEIDSNWGTSSFKTPVISRDKIGVIGLELTDPFNKDEALYKIFPGHHYPLYKEHTWAIWRSPKYPSRKFNDDGMMHDFPGKRNNLTCVSDIRRYTDDSGKQNIMVSFETNELGPLDVLYCGRFSGPDISVAVFTKQSDKWVLKNFDMALACYGSYRHSSLVDTVKLGVNNYGINIAHEVNPPGDPWHTYFHMYGLIDGQYNEVLSLGKATCYMWASSEWKTRIERQNTNHPFDDLKLITTGNFDGAAYDTCFKKYGDTLIDLPEEVYGQTATAYSFSFRITRLYHFQDGHYKMISKRRHVYNVVEKKKEKK